VYCNCFQLSTSQYIFSVHYVRAVAYVIPKVLLFLQVFGVVSEGVVDAGNEGNIERKRH